MDFKLRQGVMFLILVQVRVPLGVSFSQRVH